MKVLNVTQGYFPGIGGTELMMQRISEEFVRQFGDEVTVFTTNCYGGDAFYTPGLPRMKVGMENINGVQIRRFPVRSRVSQFFRVLQKSSLFLPSSINQHLRTLSSGPIIPDLRNSIRKIDFDILVASSFPLVHMYNSIKVALELNRPCVFIGGIHPLDGWGFNRPMIYQAIQKANGYIAYTQFEANYVTQKGIPSDKVAVIGLGVDIEPFKQTNATIAKQQLGIDPNTPLVGFIGQLGWHKGVDTLVRAMPKVWQIVPEAMLLIAGAKALFSKNLEQLLAKLSPDQREKIILRYNFQNEEKPWLFSAVDIFAYPSGFESFGIAFLESWAIKRPVIGCRAGAIPWVITAGRDGLLIDFQNDEQLAEAIISLLRNPYWARQLGEAGYKKVINHYRWPQVASCFRDFYLKVS